MGTSEAKWCDTGNMKEDSSRLLVHPTSPTLFTHIPFHLQTSTLTAVRAHDSLMTSLSRIEHNRPAHFGTSIGWSPSIALPPQPTLADVRGHSC